MRSHIAVLVTLAIALTFAACGRGSAPPTPQGHTLQGTVALASRLSRMSSDEVFRRIADEVTGDGPALPDVDWTVGEPCVGSGEFSDLQGGAQVVVKNDAGTIIAADHLDAGTGVGIAYLEPNHNGYTPICEFAFTIDGVPDSDFYSVEIGTRGAVTYSKSEIESNNWTLSVMIGP